MSCKFIEIHLYKRGAYNGGERRDSSGMQILYRQVSKLSRHFLFANIISYGVPQKSPSRLLMGVGLKSKFRHDYFDTTVHGRIPFRRKRSLNRTGILDEGQGNNTMA